MTENSEKTSTDKRGVAAKLFAVVLLSTGALSSMLDIKSGMSPGAIGYAMMALGVLIFIGAAVWNEKG